MDADRFDRIAAALAAPRTRRAALAGALSLAGLAGADAQATCKENGQRCSGGEACCSGSCRPAAGGKKRCRRAPDQGICTAEFDRCKNNPTDDLPNVKICGSPGCQCTVTIRGRSFCSGGNVECQACSSNAECANKGQGWVCIRCADPTWGCSGGTAYVNPCPNRCETEEGCAG